MVPLTLFLLACSQPTTDLTLRLPGAGVILVNDKSSSTTRTPLGAERLEVLKTLRMQVLGGGRLGKEELHWVEEITRYSVTYESANQSVTWRLGGDEALPKILTTLAPPPPREFWVMGNGEIWRRDLPLSLQEQEALLEEAPLPDPTQVALATMPAYLAGLLQAPLAPVPKGHSWSWTTSQRVTGGSSTSNTVSWRLDRVQGTQAVLKESLALQAAMAPASGQFRTTSVSGSGEMRFDVQRGLPTKYTSAFDADLASPSAVGTATMKVDVKFKVQ